MAHPAHNEINTLNHEEKTLWLRLLRSENVGPLTFHRLLKRYVSAAESLKALPNLAQQGGRKTPLRLCPLDVAEKELEAIYKNGAYLIASCETNFPPLLRHLQYTPPLLTVKGNVDLLTTPTFAIVGARNASLAAKKLTETLATHLGDAGWTVSSGLARGIDAHAHKAALNTGTVAVVAGGLDQIYPPENEALHHEIAEKGIIIAESPWGTKPQANLFPRRNRIISGISRGVLVVEAALKSGSLITANYASDQGRDVFAVPGSPLDPRARGCNKLIREGAILTESIHDIERELSPNTPEPLREVEHPYDASMPSHGMEKIRNILLENLGPTPIEVDELARECHLSPQDVWGVFLELEIAGRIERHPGGKISLRLES